MTGLWLVSYVALWILLLAVAVALVSVLHNLGVVIDTVNSSTMRQRYSNLRTGQALPDVTWRTLTGGPRKLSEFRGRRQAFEIVSTTCGSCVQFLRQVGERDPDPVDSTLRERTVVCVGDAEGAARLLRSAGVSDEQLAVMVDPDGEVLRKWGIVSTPSTVIVDEELRVVRQVHGVTAQPADGPPAHANGERQLVERRS